MGKVNILTLLTTVITQFVVGYFWYSPQLFGDVVTTSGIGIDFLKLDVVTGLFLVLGSYGLIHILDMLVKLTGTKDIGGGLKIGVTYGVFGLGLPVLMLLNLMGLGKVLLLVVFVHLVIISTLTSLITIKFKKG